MINIIKATESTLQARMDECAFEISSCIQNQTSEGTIDRFLKTLSDYEHAASQFEVLQKIKQHFDTPPEEASVQDEN